MFPAIFSFLRIIITYFFFNFDTPHYYLANEEDEAKA